MYSNTIKIFTDLAQQKSHRVKHHFLAFLISSAMAGAFIGLGIILIFSVASGIEPMYQKLVMGASFGVALTLVVFAGSELFTGHTMYMTLGLLQKVIKTRELLLVWSSSWFGNLIGSIVLVCIFIIGGGAEQLTGAESLLQKIASYKVNSSASELIARGTLCNFLVCLALWMSARVDSDTTKCIVIFWCLFAFIASGYEHSVANMTLLTLALMAEHSHDISVFGVMHNLAWVTIGNIIGGAVFVGFSYWSVSDKPTTSNNNININNQNTIELDKTLTKEHRQQDQSLPFD